MFDDLDFMLFCVIVMCIYAIFELVMSIINKKEK